MTGLRSNSVWMEKGYWHVLGLRTAQRQREPFSPSKGQKENLKRSRNTFPRYSASLRGGPGTADTTLRQQWQLPLAAALTSPARPTTTPRGGTTGGGGARAPRTVAGLALRPGQPLAPHPRDAGPAWAPRRQTAGGPCSDPGRATQGPATASAQPDGYLGLSRKISAAGAAILEAPSTRPLPVSCSEPDQWRPRRTETRKGQAAQRTPGPAGSCGLLRAPTDRRRVLSRGPAGPRGHHGPQPCLSRLFGVQAVLI